MGRVSLLAASAAERAVADAGLVAADLVPDRTSIVVGSTAGSPAAEMEFWGRLGGARSARGVKGTLFFQAMSHTCAANGALHLGVRGEVLATNSACASSNQAIGMAAHRIRFGQADVALAGGAEELHESGGVVFDSLGAASRGFNDAPEATPRPFDARRDGIVVGEGAGIFVLEARDHALARGARILGEIVGFGTSCDAFHMSTGTPEGMAAAIRRCLHDAGRDPAVVDYVNAHATGTTVGDAAEAEALYAVFGERVPVSSSKGHLGHTLGACGALESAVVLEAFRRGILPGTRNLDDPDVAPIQLLRGHRPHAAAHVLKTNFAFGGVNSVLLFAHPDV
jgi:3-oxoacyl-[acyl-carrier-protein] synthase II